MNIRNLFAASILVALFTNPVQADSGIYVAGSIGSASLSEEFDGFDVDSNSTAWRLNIRKARSRRTTPRKAR